MVHLRFAALAILVLEAASVLTAPIAHNADGLHAAGNGLARAGGRGVRNNGARRNRGNRNGTAIATSTSSAAAPVATLPADGAAGGEEGEGNDIVRDGVFGTPTKLDGGNVKQDTEFTAEAGKFEVEFAAATGTDLTVITQKAAGTLPAGFKLLDSNSFTVSTSTEVRDSTVLKIDYIFDNAAPAVVAAGADITKTLIGKKCGVSGVWVVDGLGESEFEADENEIVLKVLDITGEFAIFIPDGTAAAPPATGEAAPPAAGGEKEKEGEKEGEIEIQGTFDVPVTFPGGGIKADVLFPPSEAGGFEVEHNGTSTATITVTAKAPSANPPAGHLFVDGSAFVVTSNAKADSTLQKIDYIFTEAVKATIDASKGTIGKLDAAKGEYVVAVLGESALGEFEFEEEENEWTLSVNDLNGEWVMLVPTSAIKA